MLAAPASGAERPPALRAGVGKADITPKLGYYLGGWTRADRTALGQHTRLHARALVLRRGRRKVALVSVDLFMVAGGMVKQIGDRLRERGLSERTILVSASHTHSGPGGFGNFPSQNTRSPSRETVTDPFTFVRLLDPQPADPELYRFLLERIETAIVRADEDLGPAAAGWGSARILGLTRNRSLEAHLHNHGIVREYGEGRPAEDPHGREHTIDPAVDVLRVDKLVRSGGRSRRVPIGAWSTFANHGTVTKDSFPYYNGDHTASAMRVFERRVRRAGRVGRGQEVVNVYGNSNEGDMSAGMDHHGPAGSDYVGRVEARAMLRAWRRARLSRRPPLATRWTRMCFCGQEVEGGRVSDHSEVGAPFATGSEEHRGPLFEITGRHYEGATNPAASGPHAPKFAFRFGELPNRLPLVAVRVGRRLIVSVPGEGTKEVGARIRAATAAAVAGSGMARVVVSGLANEFAHYFTTPEEYDRQHYEGGSTQFGRLSSVLLTRELARLARALARGEPAPPPAAFDPTNGVRPDGPPYGSGAAGGTITEQPALSYERFEHARLAWRGGPEGLDRPVDRAFVTAQRRRGDRWVRTDDDLGLAMLWTVDDEGGHAVKWEIPRNAPPGTYRLVVRAKRYRLRSRSFRVLPSDALRVVAHPGPDGRTTLFLAYPRAVRDVDLTHRPRRAPIRSVRLTVGDRAVRLRGNGRRTLSVRPPAGEPLSVAAGSARDRYGNRNGSAVKLR